MLGAHTILNHLYLYKLVDGKWESYKNLLELVKLCTSNLRDAANGPARYTYDKVRPEAIALRLLGRPVRMSDVEKSELTDLSLTGSIHSPVE